MVLEWWVLASSRCNNTVGTHAKTPQRLLIYDVLRTFNGALSLQPSSVLKFSLLKAERKCDMSTCRQSKFGTITSIVEEYSRCRSATDLQQNMRWKSHTPPLPSLLSIVPNPTQQQHTYVQRYSIHPKVRRTQYQSSSETSHCCAAGFTNESPPPTVIE